MKWILYIAIMMMVLSCRVSKQSAMEHEPNSSPERDEIIFINLLFTYDSLMNSTSVELIDFKIVEGKLKSEFTSYVNLEGTALRIAFYEDSSKLLKSIIIDNPLFRNAEHSIESGEISRTMIKLPQTEFSLRTQLPHASSYIIVSEASKTDEINGNVLLKFELGDK